MKPVIAMDIGGTVSRAALISGTDIHWRAQRSTPARAGPEAMLETMDELLREAPAAAAADAAVGVAIAGQVAEGRVSAHNPALLPGWTDYPLQARLARRWGRVVRVCNDARAAAWAEYRHGAGRGCDEFLFVTVSTGVGAGLVLGGRLHQARNGMDAELGETLLPDGRTLENLASGTALNGLARAAGRADARALFDAADAGDAAAEALLAAGIAQLARKLGDLAVLLGIARTALGGGVGLRPGYLERLQRALDGLPALYRQELRRAELGGDAGLVGAAELARC
ncbi:ROK family protein [Roseateles sp. DAIF2]|uniref:ROK family protein n=1 Tax=Roseateles sp. DAIF2 TaxID=2714952 RepID=UPI0018A28A04|nr:ROK family protein [Roseateles sp. DAIF2]QPF72603.1 ROK family protein [Roseateles sp. DAIF2]